MITLRRALTAFSVASLLAGAATCVGDEPKIVPSSGAPDATTCSAGQTLCGETCIDLARDHDNCGACGKACAAGELCSSGACAASCGGASTACAGACMNLQSDNANCGKCGQVCAVGQVCSKGQCATVCASGLQACSGACVDTQTDARNCGGCGTPCAQGQVCSGGKCATSCPSGETPCTPDGGSPLCTSTQTDDANCGGCGVACGQGTACAGGKCSVTCQPGQTPCAGADAGAGYCASTQTDNANCGGCGIACSSSAPLCAGGACTAIYNDMTKASNWSSFDTTTANASAKGFVGAAFDGRYLYLGPQSNVSGGGTADGIVARYDAQSAFASAGSWSTFDTTALAANARGYLGTLFDGRFVYFVPHSTGSTVLSIVARYDTTASFTSGGSWSTFDATNVDSNAKGLVGATFDGRYVYFAPNWNGASASGLVVRYDTSGAFAQAGSWATFDAAANVDPNAKYFIGAVFDGRYVYLVPDTYGPAGGNVVTRFDTQAAFTSPSAWATFDSSKINTNVKGFNGAVFDGRYLYLVPNYNQLVGFNGLVARYDTQSAFTSTASWSTFDTTAINAGAKGFAAGAFDGRYIYLVPNADANATYDGIVARFDTRATFTSASSWSTFDMATANSDATGYWGAAFDGRYVYFVPFLNGSTGVPHGTVMRFDAKAPPSMPKLPGWNGSFF